MSIDYDLRPATDADRDTLLRLFRAAFEDFVLRDEGLQSDEWWRNEFDEDYADGCMSIVVVDGDHAGIVDLHRDDDGSIFLSVIAIAPAHQGGGLGTRILRDLMASAPRVQLSVRKGNIAKRLYDRLGFRVIEDTDRRWRMEFP